MSLLKKTQVDKKRTRTKLTSVLCLAFSRFGTKKFVFNADEHEDSLAGNKFCSERNTYGG